MRDAFLVAKEAYGSVGYYEMTSFPSFSVRTEPEPDGLPTRIDGDPVVDLTMNFQEGEQYFINRITFVGNNTTHDEVIRREISLVERNVFNTEALKFSVRRLNQLGYFEPLDEENAIQIEKRPGADNEVDLTINLQEANLNQLTFGAGASQFDGFFLQLGFTTTNFLGRGESLTLQLQNGERIKNYKHRFYRAVSVSGSPSPLGSTCIGVISVSSTSSPRALSGPPPRSGAVSDGGRSSLSRTPTRRRWSRSSTHCF